MILVTPLTKSELEYIKQYGLYDPNKINNVANALMLSRPLRDLTNGDVIQTVFPNAEIKMDAFGNARIVSSHQLGTITFKAKWWNAPYKEDK